MAAEEGFGPPLLEVGLPGGYLCLEALHQNGDQQIKQHVVPEGHEGDEVKGGPGRGGGHAVVEDFIPVLLGQDLRAGDTSQGPKGASDGSCSPLGPEILEPERR